MSTASLLLDDITETMREATERLRLLIFEIRRHSPNESLAWFDADADLRAAIRGRFLGNQDSAPDDARWIATMSPLLGVALSNWLDAVVVRVEEIVDSLPPGSAQALPILRHDVIGFDHAVAVAYVALGREVPALPDRQKD